MLKFLLFFYSLHVT